MLRFHYIGKSNPQQPFCQAEFAIKLKKNRFYSPQSRVIPEKTVIIICGIPATA